MSGSSGGTCAACQAPAAARCRRCSDPLCAEHAAIREDERCARCERDFQARTLPLRVAAAIPVGTVALALCGLAAIVLGYLLGVPPELSIMLILCAEFGGAVLITRGADRLLSARLRARFLEAGDGAIPRARLLP